MSRQSPISRLAPPDWLVRNLRPQPAPIPWAAVARAAIAMAAAARRSASPPGSPRTARSPPWAPCPESSATPPTPTGCGSSTSPCRSSSARSASRVGALVFGHGWVAVVAVTGVALVSGMISTIGAVASVSGLLLLLNCVIGAGLPLPGEWWLAPLLMTRRRTPRPRAGAARLAAAVRSAGAGGRRRHVPDRRGPARGGGDPENYDETRHAVTQSLNQAYDLVLARRALAPRPQPRTRASARPVERAHPDRRGRARRPPVRRCRSPPTSPTPYAISPTPSRPASTDPIGPSTCPRPKSPTARAVDHALRHAADRRHREQDPTPRNVDDRLGRPAALRVRAARAARNVVLSGASWRYGLRLALCIGLAQILVSIGAGAALLLGGADHHLRPQARLRLGVLAGRAARARHGGRARRRGRWSSPRCRAGGGTCP